MHWPSVYSTAGASACAAAVPAADGAQTDAATGFAEVTLEAAPMHRVRVAA